MSNKPDISLPHRAALGRPYKSCFFCSKQATTIALIRANPQNLFSGSWFF